MIRFFPVLLCALAFSAAGATADDDLTAARELAAHGYIEVAAQLLDEILSDGDPSYEARLLAGIVRAQRGETAVARELFADLLDAHPERSELHDNLAVLENLAKGPAGAGEAALRDASGKRFLLGATASAESSVRVAQPLVTAPVAAPEGPASVPPRRVAVEEPVAPPVAVPEKPVLVATLDFESGDTAGAPIENDPSGAEPTDRDVATVDGTGAAEVAPPAVPPPPPDERVVFEPLPDDPEPAPPSPPPAADDEAERIRRQVRLVIDGWAKAWSAQRVEDYLSYYADDFRPDSGVGRQVWADQRRERLLRPTTIRVWIVDLDVELPAPDRAVARFTQHYDADHYQDVVIKVLELRREAAGWRIVSERVVS